MHFSRLIRIGCISGLVASPLLGQNAVDPAEHARQVLRESAGNPGADAPKSTRDQLIARITKFQMEGKLTDQQAKYLRRDVEKQMAKAEGSKDTVQTVKVAAHLQERIDATAQASTNLSKNHSATTMTARPDLEITRQYEAQVAAARNEREARLRAEAATAEAARRVRQAQKQREFEAAQIARAEALHPKPKSEPATTSAQTEQLQARAIEVLHQQEATEKNLKPTLVAANTVEKANDAAPHAAIAATDAASVAQIEKVQALALEVLHAQSAQTNHQELAPSDRKTSSHSVPPAEESIQSKFAKPAEAPVDAHERALKALREKMQKPVPSAPASNLTQAQIAEVQERALEVLRQQAAPAAVASASPAEPDPALQQRAREIVRQQKAEAEQARVAAKKATTTSGTEASGQIQPPSTATAVAQVDPAVLERARAILREHQESPAKAIPSTNAAPAASTNAAIAALPTMRSAAPAAASDDALERARQVLRGLEATPVAATSAVGALPSSAPAAQPTPAATAPATASDDALERARAVLRQSQGQPSAQPQLSSSVPAASPDSGLNEKTRQMLLRQNKELQQRAGRTSGPTPASDSGKVDPYARAREVLRNQPNSTKDEPVSPAVAAPSTTAPASPSIIAKPAVLESQPLPPVQAKSAKPVTPAPSAPAATEPVPDRNAAILERAREILRQQKDSGPAVAPTVLPSPVPPANTATPNTDLIHERALEALHAQEAATARTSNSATAPSLSPNSKSSSATVTNPASAVPPVAAAPVVKSKKEKLADLLELYKADRITPEQYHAARAKIIAEP